MAGRHIGDLNNSTSSDKIVNYVYRSFFTPMDGAVQPDKGRTLWSTVQDRNEEGRGSPYNQAYGAGSCGKNHGPAVLAAPSTGGHTQGRQGGATTVDGGRDRRGGGPSTCQSQEGTRSRWDNEQCVDHRTSANPGILDAVFNLALKSGVFPTRWKVARLVLLQKPGKPVGDPASFRPLSMLDTVRKIFEQVIAEWLRKHFRGKHNLSANQYGFRAGCSTIDAARKLQKLAASAIKERQFGTAISLDIQNAFNSMLWMRILEALANAKVLVYLRNIIRDYFRDRVVFAQMASGTIRKEMTCGVPQGSVLGLLLWNIAFDNILKEEVLPGGKCHLLCRRYPGGYDSKRYSHARAEGKHHPEGYNPLD